MEPERLLVYMLMLMCVYEYVIINTILLGTGSMVFKDGTYNGEWRDCKRHGLGKIVLHKGGSYEGQWEAGKWSGEGTLIQPNGVCYKGTFLNYQKHGQGRLIHPDGRIEEGRWWKDKRAL